MERVLVADDGSEAALKAVETAAALAAKMGASLTAIAVIDAGNRETADVHALVRSERADTSSVPSSLVDAAAERLDRCASIAQRYGVAQFQAEKRVGDDPAQEIMNFARDHAVDLIVVGSRGLGRRAGLLLGSVSQKLANSAPSSVLIIR